ncbi:hypothetical protein ACFZDG_18540 [Kitasatospora xanthocidica]|uniref:hypothetical protein n=1 Tax=Kitasatospora xanthocidica TaxID=83382 RepID=UPI0036E140AE
MTPQWKQLLDHVMAVPEQAYETWNSTDGWDNDTPFGRQFGENGVSWCVIFDWCMYADVGLAAIVPKVDNVSVFTDWARARGQWSDYPSIGSWVNFGNGSHTELVVGFDADNVYTKGGNSVKAGSTDAGQGNGVWSHATARRSSRVVGYFAPRFADGQCPPTADPADPRGGRAQASYRWTGPDPTPNTTPAPTAPAPSEEDDMPSINEIRAGVRAELEAFKSTQTHDTLYWLDQAVGRALGGQLADAGASPLAWLVPALGDHLKQIVQALPAGASPDQIKAAVAQALANGIQLTVTTKGA